VLNLATNAGQAMPRGGVLHLGTGEEAGQVVLAIADSGPGMDEATRARIFEPYFTTRAEGTGLGLATVRELVESAGGRLEVDSHPGLGSVFRVVLPAAGGSRPPFGTGRTALVADDDPGSRELVKRILESAGFDVSEAASTDEALQTARWLKGTIDVLIADVVMPGIGGRALAERLKAPATVLVSGYPQGDLGGENRTYLAKPFASRQLLAAVRAAMPAD
jgi:CheY-like chemotaxis protein